MLTPDLSVGMPELQITAEQLDEIVLEPPRLVFGEKDIPGTVGTERAVSNVGMKHDLRAFRKLLPTHDDEVVTVVSKKAQPWPLFCQMLLYHRLRDAARHRFNMCEPTLLLSGVRGQAE